MLPLVAAFILMVTPHPTAEVPAPTSIQFGGPHASLAACTAVKTELQARATFSFDPHREGLTAANWTTPTFECVQKD